MKKKTIAIGFIIAVLFFSLVFKDNLVRSYVSLHHDKLAVYASGILETGEETKGNYGLWETYIYPEDGMVEFYTGGWGLVPNSTYKGFYYSADNTHKLFSAAYKETTSLEIDGDYASWTDGTDNHGTSIRITENWFWFEASF